MAKHLGQGATEYLVLLAVVLIIALVAVALLGFFPGTSTDTRIAQSQTYWRAASPIAIIELNAQGTSNGLNGRSELTFRIRNSGAYRITITKIFIGNSSNSISSLSLNGVETSMSTFLQLAPGEETFVGFPAGSVTGTWREMNIFPANGTASNSHDLYGGTSTCQYTTGTTEVRGFGFEYQETIEGQVITKDEIGAVPLVVKCSSPLF